MAKSQAMRALCAHLLIVGARGQAPATQPHANFTLQELDMCPGSYMMDPPPYWTWSKNVDVGDCKSCNDPPMQNWGKMCAGDPTSVVIENLGQPSCLRTSMPDCKMNMHDVEQIDFDVRVRDCGATWAAPLWLTPNYWDGKGFSGEIDLVELCPAGDVWTNFAGAAEPIGYQKKWGFADPNWFVGHVTMWKGDNVRGGITAKVCDEAERDGHGGVCSGEGAAYYPALFESEGCSGDQGDCMFTMVSDIWNGYGGDPGFYACSKGYPQTSNCKQSIRNIRVKSSRPFEGNCAALNPWHSKEEVV